MRAGRMNVRLKLQAESTSIALDAMGDTDPTWTTEATLYAEPMDTRATEPTEGRAERARMERTWRIRHRNGVTTDKRLVEEGSTSNVWGIRGVYDPTGRREELRVESRAVGV